MFIMFKSTKVGSNEGDIKIKVGRLLSNENRQEFLKKCVAFARKTYREQ